MMIDHLSYSSISTYLSCARAWRFHYIDKVKTPRATALAFGSAFHDTLEDYIAARALGAEIDLIPTWYQKWEQQAQRKDINWDSETPESLNNEGVRLLSNESILATVNDIVPLMVDDEPVIEKQIALQVPGVPVPVTGFVDIVTADGVPCDFKTSSRSWSPAKAQDEMQPIFYLAALAQEGFVNSMAFRHYIFVKTKEPRMQVIDTQRSAGELFWLLELIQEAWQAISKGVYPPNPTTWKCSEKWCDYWHLCRGKALK